MAAVLRLSDIHKSFAAPAGPLSVLSGATLELAQGECVILSGPSGSGKSTLLLIAGMLLAPDQGSVELQGRQVQALSAAQRARERAGKIGFVFQQFHLLPYLTVLENVLAARLGLVSAKLEDQGRALELLDGFQLSARLHHLPGQLSAGEQQRVALARALLNRPVLLVADEPTGNLDPDNARTVLQALASYAKNGGAVLLVTHLTQTGIDGGRRLKMQDGRVTTA